MTPIPTHVRAWLYRVSLAVFPILVAHGVITATDASLYGALVVAALDVGLAAAHTPNEPQKVK